MGAFRDDREALLARVQVLEGELARGRRDAALAELAAIRELLAEADSRIRRDEETIDALARRLDVIEGSIRGDVITTPVQSSRRVIAAATCGAALLLLGLGLAVGTASSPPPLEVTPIPPTAPVPPRPAPEWVPSPYDVETPAERSERVSELPVPDFFPDDHASERPERPPRDAVAAAFRSVLPAAEPCGRELPDANLQAVRSRVIVRFSSDGVPTSIRAEVPDTYVGHEAAASCIARAFEPVRVPPFRAHTFAVSFPVRLSRTP